MPQLLSHGKGKSSSLLLADGMQSDYSASAWHSDSHILMIIPPWNIDLSGIRIGVAWRLNAAKFNPFPLLRLPQGDV